MTAYRDTMTGYEKELDQLEKRFLLLVQNAIAKEPPHNQLSLAIGFHCRLIYELGRKHGISEFERANRDYINAGKALETAVTPFIKK